MEAFYHSDWIHRLKQLDGPLFGLILLYALAHMHTDTHGPGNLLFYTVISLKICPSHESYMNFGLCSLPLIDCNAQILTDINSAALCNLSDMSIFCM